MKTLLVRMMLISVLLLGAHAASAEPSCNSQPQQDGSTWKICVGDDGGTYCESCPAGGGACSRVGCN